MKEPPSRWTDESGQPNVGRHRTRALSNGLVIGIGIAWTITPAGFNPFGIILVVLGIGIEYWHRQRFKSGSL